MSLRSGSLRRHPRDPVAPLALALALTAAAGAAACAGGGEPAGEVEPAPEPRVVQPGAPGERSRRVEPGGERERPRYTEADVAFMQDMIVHHAQAVLMAALVPARTDRREIRLLADRIAASQESEIALMRRWLESRGEAVPDPGAAAHAGHRQGTMAGMASPEELARLEAAEGAAFDRLFLELMIRHHEGALEMVATRQEAGGVDPEVHMFAGHVDADQRAEIARMRTLQDVLFQ